MDAASTLRAARARAGLSLRGLARAAGTSHATLAAYERGTKAPSVATLVRIVRAAGFVVDWDLLPVAGGPDRAARGRELVAVLDLASQFPSRPGPAEWPRLGSAR